MNNSIFDRWTNENKHKKERDKRFLTFSGEDMIIEKKPKKDSADKTRISEDDTIWSNEIFEEAADAFAREIKINNKYDIPYLAGYSKDGKTIYIDRHIPQFAAINEKSYNIYTALILHEITEKLFEDRFPEIPYAFAHQIALTIEKRKVETDGISWNKYSAFMDRWIKFADDENLTMIPFDLDIKPYEDENDRNTLEKMRQGISEIKKTNLMGSLKQSK